MRSPLQALLVLWIPYPDPWRRWRMRRKARALVTCSPWPDQAASPADIAQLAMLRLLYLQSEGHRAARVGGFESTMLLARASVEACISGLYWLEQPDAGAQLTNANAKSAKQMLKGIMDALRVPPGALDEAARLIGEPDNLPKLQLMAKQVTQRSGISITQLLYEQVYTPLSFLFEHTTGIALQRHIDRDGQLLATPEQWWTRRRALHTIDLCTGYLALVLARHAGGSTKAFDAYAGAHARRMVVPAVTIFALFARRAIRLSQLPKMAREVSSLWRASDTYSSLATDDEREAFAKDRIRRAAVQLKLFDDEELLDGLIEILIKHLVRAGVVQTEG